MATKGRRRKVIVEDPVFAAEMAALEEARHEAWVEEHRDYYEKKDAMLARPVEPVHVSRLKRAGLKRAGT